MASCGGSKGREDGNEGEESGDGDGDGNGHEHGNGNENGDGDGDGNGNGNGSGNGDGDGDGDGAHRGGCTMTPRELMAAFEVVADAPDGIKRLRELVLSLAVRGKLVGQDEGDEPASILIRRIGGTIYEQSGLGQIPTNWCWARFDSVAEIASNLVNPDAYPDMPHVAPDNIEKGTGRLLPYRTVSEDGVRSGNHKFHPGQILYSKIRPNLSKVVTVDFTGLCSADMYPVNPRISRSYLHLYMLSWPFLLQVTADDNRLAMPKVNQAQLSAVVVPVPPLAEQHRIVARVDELMALLDRLESAHKARDEARRAARAAALAALRDAEDADAVETAWARIAGEMEALFAGPDDITPARQAILQLAIRGRLVPHSTENEPAEQIVQHAMLRRRELTRRWEPLVRPSVAERAFETPTSWAWARLDDLCAIASGVTKGRRLEGQHVGTFPYLRVANVQAGHLNLSIIKTIEIPLDELEDYRLLSGDVLLTEGGDWDKLGRSAIWDGEIEDCIHQNHVFRARPLVEGVTSRWVSLYTNSGDGRQYFQSCAKQTTNLASINMTQLKNCPIPLPPLPEQHRIVAKVDALMALCDALEARLRAARELHAQLAAAAVHHLDV